MAVKVIKARPSLQNQEQKKKKLRVCAYGRVSTDDQESSYETQCTYYTNYIQSNPDWTFVGMYADEGISGTSAKKRTEFQRMIQDCKDGKIDLVLTKSISRWARNTLDTLTYIRELKALGIAVFFEKESINTMDGTGEVLLTILASLAQQESESISKNVTIGLNQTWQNGNATFSPHIVYGLKRGEGKRSVEIVPEEADIVRDVYRLYLEGFTLTAIARKLNDRGLRSRRGKEWTVRTVENLLVNEKYAGDVLAQKTFTENVLTHKTILNEGQKPQYLMMDNHDPIVPREVFHQMQGEVLRRKDEPMMKLVRSPFCGRVVCDDCGALYKRFSREKTFWQHPTADPQNQEKGACRNRVYEKDITDAVIAAFNTLPAMWDDLVQRQAELRYGDVVRLDSLIEQNTVSERRMEDRVLNAATDEEKTYLEEQIVILREERNGLILERSKAAAPEVHIRMLLELVSQMRDKHEEWLSGRPKVKEQKEFEASCRDYDEFFERTRREEKLDQEGRVTELNDDMIIRYIEKVIIGKDRITVEFRGGVRV